jgi:predicted DNA binding protein
VEPRAEAGVEGDPDAGNELLGDAVRTGELQLVRNTQDGDRTTGQRDSARSVGSRAAAAIPITHQGMVYGVLEVYSERTDAFAGKERDVLGQLGDVIGHAIAALDRKRALMSDEVVELELRLPRLVDPSLAGDGRITIDRVTPVGDTEYLAYGTATRDAAAVLRTLRDDRPGWGELRTFDERDEEVRFEQRLADPPVTSIVADHGGNFKRGVIEDGAYSATIQFPPGTDVRRVVGRIREAYPNARVVSQQQVTRGNPSSRHVLDALAEDLTERQRMALEAGYFGGFFEWPRHRSGEDVAQSLGIGASTFHQHVRKAERKLLDVAFADL